MFGQNELNDGKRGKNTNDNLSILPSPHLSNQWHTFWLNLADRWAIDHFRQQQTQFNQLALNQLDSLQHRLQILHQDQQALSHTLDQLNTHIK